ncbi:hypothetical protein SAMN02799630_01831 [Paenibacillus sp. UNCCL117]|nr:hypothetical protein SAMN04488602_104320 [Paenibacillus sp. cl123]SFW29993.1 hypothetical protein SAMN02799630_01831 [Paenibacillus sp. UNCCL117]
MKIAWPVLFLNILRWSTYGVVSDMWRNLSGHANLALMLKVKYCSLSIILLR